jgi:hypothetical protein
MMTRDRSSFKGKPKASARSTVADAFGLPLNEELGHFSLIGTHGATLSN